MRPRVALGGASEPKSMNDFDLGGGSIGSKMLADRSFPPESEEAFSMVRLTHSE
jgi:hypothetical protein